MPLIYYADRYGRNKRALSITPAPVNALSFYVDDINAILDRETVLRLSRDIQQWLLENPEEEAISQSEREQHARQLQAAANTVAAIKEEAVYAITQLHRVVNGGKEDV